MFKIKKCGIAQRSSNLFSTENCGHRKPVICHGWEKEIDVRCGREGVNKRASFRETMIVNEKGGRRHSMSEKKADAYHLCTSNSRRISYWFKFPTSYFL